MTHDNISDEQDKRRRELLTRMLDEAVWWTDMDGNMSDMVSVGYEWIVCLLMLAGPETLGRKGRCPFCAEVSREWLKAMHNVVDREEGE